MRMSAGREEAFTNTVASITGDDGRFVIQGAPTGQVTIIGTMRWMVENDYFPARGERTIHGSGTIDIGDIHVVRRRAKMGEEGDLGFDYRAPCVVSRIDPQGPAANVDLKIGDTITAIDGLDITGNDAPLTPALLTVPSGTKISLRLARGVSVDIVAK
jgi:S1-C subfamily serine protease